MTDHFLPKIPSDTNPKKSIGINLHASNILADLKKEKLADRAYRLLEELIVMLMLPPASILSEAELSAKLKIGRTPIREALQKLAADNLILIQPRRAIVVNDIHISEHLIVLETRRVLERLIIVSAAKRATSFERKQLSQYFDNMMASAISGDMENFMRHDKYFDMALGKISRNYFAARSCAPLQSLSRRFWVYYQNSGDLMKSANLHRDIMLAIIDSDIDKAGIASDNLIDYLENSAKKILAI